MIVRIFLTCFAFLASFFFWATPVKADDPTQAPPCAEAITTNGCEKIDSAIGTLGTSPEVVVGRIFSVLMSISGGIAVLIFMSSGYRLMTSQGNPEGIKNSQEMIVSAMTGLLFVILSYALLGFIGNDLLKLPGFN